MATEHERGLERAYLAAPCNAAFNPEIQVLDGVARIRLRVGPNQFHGGGAVHGHVLFKALDDAAFFAANSALRTELLLTQGFSLHFLRPVRGRLVRSEGRLVQRTRRVLVAEAVAWDERDREVARGSGTFLPGGVPLKEVPGYLEDPSGRCVRNA